MNTFPKLLASLAILTLTFAPAAAEDNGGDWTGDQYAVCSAILESCMAVCSIESDTGGIITPRDVCEMQCTNAYRLCMKGIMRTSVALKQSQRNPLQNFIGDGTPNNTPPPPTGDTDQPTDPTGGNGGFNPGAAFGGPATTIGPVGNVIY